jgi:PAS domain S-box-containing protein
LKRSLLCVPRPASRHEPTDAPIVATPEELQEIREMLGYIEKMLAGLFGTAYDRGPASLEARAAAAASVDAHFDEVVERWSSVIEQSLEVSRKLDRSSMGNSLARFAAHLRDPDDIRTYIHLRRHCQEGMLARAKPSQFNIFHIALKQVILQLVLQTYRGRQMELIRDSVVAAIDERRLMVAQFYIDSRETALRASEEKYRNAINHAPDPMYELDPKDGTVLSANSAAIELHRILPYESGIPLVGARMDQLTPPEMQAEVFKHFRQVVNEGVAEVLDLPLRGRYFDVNSALISAGNHRFIQMILHDVTQRHEMLDTLLKAERLAAAGTFASGVAHEVNNPLASISSLVQSLLPDEKDEQRLAALHTILSQITRISRTLKDLVDFARPVSGEPAKLDLNNLITETLRLVAYNRRLTPIKLEASLSPILMPAFADANGIQQVLLNLLFNAADAITDGNGEIKITTLNQRMAQAHLPARVIMRVSDNGVGIPAENLERVFDPFFTTKPAGAGAGLGLSLCQRIILNNHGTIKVESQVNRGTTVTICLPAVSETADYDATTEVP